MHIGTIYQALINKKVANQTGGVFYTRIEDTDQKREIEGGIIQIIESLKSFDVQPDEGMVNEEEWNGEYVGGFSQKQRPAKIILRNSQLSVRTRLLEPTLRFGSS